ncbi:MAG: SDR family oxidoreductase [SAR324 cluster bacterium]|nr:SDR family oxidoreductase [SAR324 cluster bacterium]
MLLSGKKVILTGGSLGLGKAIAEELLKQGADLMICSRNQKELVEAQQDLTSRCISTDQKVRSFPCDVSKRDEVAALFSNTLEAFEGLDVLVNNAGIYGPKGPSESVDIAAWIQTLEINLLGTLYTCQHALPIFKKQKSGKIINLSGGGATAPLPNLSAYAASKAAVVRLTETLAEEVRSFGIDINAFAPGALNTRLLDEVLAAGPEKVGEEFYQKMLKQQENGGAPLEKGALLCAYLASSRSDGVTGKLISALWDGWQDFDQHLAEIGRSDIFTLRRIIPKDRGMDWE